MKKQQRSTQSFDEDTNFSEDYSDEFDSLNRPSLTKECVSHVFSAFGLIVVVLIVPHFIVAAQQSTSFTDFINQFVSSLKNFIVG